MATHTKSSKKIPTFNDVKDVVISDVVDLWRKGSLHVIGAIGVNFLMIKQIPRGRNVFTKFGLTK